MLDPDLRSILLFEVANIPRIPQLARNTQVLATTHQRIALAPLAGSGDAIVIAKELALATGLRNESVEPYLSARCIQIEEENLRELAKATYRPCTSSAYSRVTTRSPTASSPRGAMPQPPGPKAWLSIRRYLISGR